MQTESRFLELIDAVVLGDLAALREMLRERPDLATSACERGAVRGEPEPFYASIGHYLCRGDTPLHMAAAAYRTDVAQLLVEHGADCRARNRRGAEPLHYAADGGRGNAEAQAEVIRYLISAGADPNVPDRSGVTPLHRSIRTRSPAGVRALLDAGADVRRRTGKGSTPLHIAVRPTGRGGAGSPQALEHQAEIIRLLVARGADPEEKNEQGKCALDNATVAAFVVLLERGS